MISIAIVENMKQKISQIIFWVSGIIHVVLYFIVRTLLQGHKYGSPDKYGDYAKGLTSAEIEQIDGTLPFMWVVLVVVLISGFIAYWTQDATSESNPANTAALQKIAKWVMLACAAGTIYVQVIYGGYH